MKCGSVVEKSCGEVLWRESCEGVLWRSVVKECCGAVLSQLLQSIFVNTIRHSTLHEVLFIHRI